MFKWTLLLWISVFTYSANAQECADQYYLSLKIKSTSKCESSHAMTTGSGVVSPSTLATIAENPAGLAYNRQIKVNGSINVQNSTSQLQTSFQSAGGNGTMGMGASAHRYLDSSSNSSGSIYSVGLGSFLKSVSSALGGSLRLGMDSAWKNQTVYPEMKSNYTIGTLLNANSNKRIGVTAHDVGQANELYSFGVSTSLGQSSFLAVDNSVKLRSSAAMIKPAIGFNSGSAQFSLGYNFPINSNLNAWTQSPWTFGLAIWSGELAKLVMYFNRVELFYLGLTMSLTK